MLDDHGAAQRASAIAHQVFENAELLRRQLHVLARPRDLSANAVERKLAHLQPLRRRLAAAQQDAHARQQFDERERLNQIIVGPAFETFDAVVDGVASA